MAARKPKKTTPPDIKAKAIERVKAGGKRADIAKEIGVSLASINNWMASAGSTQSKLKRIGRGSEEIELLILENEYLKKKVAYLERK